MTGKGTERDCQWRSPLLHWNSLKCNIFFYLQLSLWSVLMTLSPRRSLSNDCIPSWIVLGDLSAVWKYDFCNTCYIPVSCWTFSSSFGLMPCYIFHSLFSVTVCFPVLQLYRATARINIVSSFLYQCYLVWCLLCC